MDRLDELVVFLAILETASLSGAGRKLRRSPPAVTRTLAALEERVGTRLVERTTRRLAPTEAGLRLAELARRVLADYEEAVREDADAPLRGKLKLTAPQVFGRRHVAPVVISFMDKYPAVQVELVLSDRNLDLIEEGLDLAVRIGPLADAGMVARKVGEVRRLLVASPDYISRRGAPQTPDELAAHDTIHTTGRPGPPEWRFRHAGREQTVRIAPRLLVNDVDAMLYAVKAGRGLGRPLSYQVADDLVNGSLLRLMPEWETDPLPVHLVVSSARYMAPKLRALMEHAAESLGKLEVLRRLPK
ncbi:LysR family transcriptional regulator [Undibacterium sp.]|jgi:DNA-binding transcriptional LysR family regulator|uniref:LysR family transcriptional regulator n=1 Tax=Undibacterium sp. TaxID=1914977 RepID=UPI002CBAC5B8|nr:LysR family transcriptional regulator [Undibacterium sp.]HTD06792.1 LysR family transcriptional regulator [Undibacterium sp.]